MTIFIAFISVICLTGLVWLANKILPFQICPICAGVSGTWLWLLIAYFIGIPIDPVLPAMLMGGSVVGVMYQIEKRLPTGRLPLLWKTLFIPAGFFSAYSILMQWWIALLGALAFLGIISCVFLLPKKNNGVHKESVDKLEKQMKNCC
ncbi:MAG: hypothetical protein Q8L24_01575 [bacterium]|nr:hypothetical protein [bacterium]